MSENERRAAVERLRAAARDVPPSMIAELLCERLGQNRGRRELKIAFKDGKYQRTHVELALAELDGD